MLQLLCLWPFTVNQIWIFHVGVTVCFVFCSSERFTKVLLEQQQDRAKREQERIRLLTADPFDLEAQAKIEEDIRYGVKTISTQYIIPLIFIFNQLLWCNLMIFQMFLLLFLSLPLGSVRIPGSTMWKKTWPLLWRRPRKALDRWLCSTLTAKSMGTLWKLLLTQVKRIKSLSRFSWLQLSAHEQEWCYDVDVLHSVWVTT